MMDYLQILGQEVYKILFLLIPILVYLKEEINKQLISIDKFWKNLDDIHREMLNLEGLIQRQNRCG